VTPISQKKLLGLPQSTETWYLAVRQLRTWIAPEGEEPERPYLTITVSADTGAIHGFALGEKPAPNQAKQSLFEAMTHPPEDLDVEPHRPARIFFEDRELYKAIAPALQAAGIETKYRGHSEMIDELVAHLEAGMREEAPEVPGLLSQRGISPKIASKFFVAAAEFYRAAPWVQLSNDDLLAVRVGDQKEPYFVIVMGQGGVEYGLALYLDWAQVLRFFQPRNHALEVLPSEGYHSLQFESITGVPFDDLEAIERYGWEIAGPQAYPVPLVFVPSDAVKRPDAGEILWYTAALQAIPAFVKGHLERDDQGEIQPVQARLMMPGPTGPQPVQVTYPAGDLPKAWRGVQDFDLDLEAPDSESPLPLDRRAMEGSMMDLGGMFSEPAVPSDVQKAQELMYQAWEESNPARRLALARRALKISSDCADAYVLLAEEEADTLERALSYYQKGVAGGRRALGEDYFEENSGHFWGLLETRPFMRAMEGMATCLWRLGRKEEALQTYLELLRLNPGDNQGIRYILADLLQAVNRYEALAALIKEYPDDWSAVWQYTRALLAFRQGGATNKANRALGDALKQNQHVPTYLTGEKRVPNRLPEYIGLGDEREAVAYAADHLNYWRRTPGAVEWLQEQLAAAEARMQSLIERSGFRIGDAVKVKEGITDPDFGTNMSGWQGRISEIDVETETGQPLLLIEWDSRTLEETPEEAIERSEQENLDWTQAYLLAEEVIRADPRDDPEDRGEVIWRLSERFAWSYLGEQGRRIQAILEGISTEDERAQMEAWEGYLREQLAFPFEAEVAEEQEQGALQLDDRVKVVGIEGIDDLSGVLVQVRKKGYRGALPLCDLEVSDEDLPQFQPVDDYLAWYMSSL
jgi:tetratricopeptide (TPR) repeat protein